MALPAHRSESKQEGGYFGWGDFLTSFYEKDFKNVEGAMHIDSNSHYYCGCDPRKGPCDPNCVAIGRGNYWSSALPFTWALDMAMAKLVEEEFPGFWDADDDTSNFEKYPDSAIEESGPMLSSDKNAVFASWGRGQQFRRGLQNTAVADVLLMLFKHPSHVRGGAEADAGGTPASGARSAVGREAVGRAARVTHTGVWLRSFGDAIPALLSTRTNTGDVGEPGATSTSLQRHSHLVS